MAGVLDRLRRTVRALPKAIWIDDSAVMELARALDGSNVQRHKVAAFAQAIRNGTFTFKDVPVRVFDLRGPGQF